MNLLIVLSVTTVLLVYCQLSWHNLSLNLELAVQRTQQLQQQYALTGLVEYGQYLLASRTPPGAPALKAAAKPLVLYQGPWPLVAPVYQAQVLLTGDVRSNTVQLLARLHDQAGQLVAQQTVSVKRTDVTS